MHWALERMPGLLHGFKTHRASERRLEPLHEFFGEDEVTLTGSLVWARGLARTARLRSCAEARGAVAARAVVEAERSVAKGGAMGAASGAVFGSGGAFGVNFSETGSALAMKTGAGNALAGGASLDIAFGGSIATVVSPDGTGGGRLSV